MKYNPGPRPAFRLIALGTLTAALSACGVDNETPADPPGFMNDAGPGGPGGPGGLDASVQPHIRPPMEAPDVTIIGPEDACFAKRIDAQANRPDVLIVLDRSQSMQLGGRWDPSRSAIKSITSQFQTSVDFGLSLFPGSGGDDCSAGAVDVQIQTGNAAAIAAAVDGTAPRGFTPVGATLEALAPMLGDRNQQLDVQVKPAYVLLVTDGEPTCEVDGLLIQSSPTSINRANAAIEQLKAQGIPTYVIGYSVANAAGVMDGFAQRGGTERYYPVENEAQLVEQFQKITAGLATCEFELDEAPDNPNRVKLSVDGMTLYLNAADGQGWVLDGKIIRLQSGACEKIRDGAQHQVDVTVECADIPPPS